MATGSQESGRGSYQIMNYQQWLNFWEFLGNKGDWRLLSHNLLHISRLQKHVQSGWIFVVDIDPLPVNTQLTWPVTIL